MSLRCKICGQFMADGWKHALKGSHPGNQGLMSPRDRKHAEALDAFAKTMWKGNCPLCGEKVNWHGTGSPDGDASWEVICSGCDFLFDED